MSLHVCAVIHFAQVHLDRTDACNFLVPLDWSLRLGASEQAVSRHAAAAVPCANDAVLARWCLISPHRLAEAAAYAADLGKAFDGDNATFSSEEMEAFCHHLSRDGKDGVLLWDQRAWELFRIPAGWAHMVVNLQACAKVAWDW